ncbi:MAG: SPW repeat protein [Rhizobium sp.]
MRNSRGYVNFDFDQGTWLAASPWLLCFGARRSRPLGTVACAVLLFVPAAWTASRKRGTAGAGAPAHRRS